MNQFDEKVTAILKKYAVIDEKGALTVVDLERPKNAPLGKGPLLNLDVIERFVATDTTNGRIWLDWVFDQAGGGKRAHEATARAMEQIKERFIDERVNGFQDPETKVVYQPVSAEEANTRWVAVEEEWRTNLIAADQDVAEHLGVFGYYRAWPGKEKLYERVVTALREFLELESKITEMNKEAALSDGKQVSFDPAAYEGLEDLEKAVRLVKRYFASKKARDDVRFETVAQSDLLQAVCPLTYAASVRFGFDTWAFSSRKHFEDTMTSDNSWIAHWKNTATKSVLVFLSWSVPMPCWISRKDGKFERFELVNIALEIPRDASRISLTSDKVLVHTEEADTTRTLEQIVKMIRDEVNREPDAQDEEIPIKRGPNAYGTVEEAEKRVNALTYVVTEINKWLKNFNKDSIKVEPL